MGTVEVFSDDPIAVLRVDADTELDPADSTAIHVDHMNRMRRRWEE